MIVFATSDKGGTGRSVTSSNVIYRSALHGANVCYLDFDFGSPTAGAIFNLGTVLRGTESKGLHSYLHGEVSEPAQLDVWTESERETLRRRPVGAGRLVLFPGDASGGEFVNNDEIVRRCSRLFQRLDEEYELCLVDLSAGRSYALEMVLATLTCRAMRGVESRWLVFHRWTRQHILAAAGLVYGPMGLIEAGAERGLDRTSLQRSIRFVRTAVINPDSPDLSVLRPAQVVWLRTCHRELLDLTSSHQLGRTVTLGDVPLDPILQWREQLISDEDVDGQIANARTATAFDSLARALIDDAAWGDRL